MHESRFIIMIFTKTTIIILRLFALNLIVDSACGLPGVSHRTFGNRTQPNDWVRFSLVIEWNQTHKKNCESNKIECYRSILFDLVWKSNSQKNCVRFHSMTEQNRIQSFDWVWLSSIKISFDVICRLSYRNLELIINIVNCQCFNINVIFMLVFFLIVAWGWSHIVWL